MMRAYSSEGARRYRFSRWPFCGYSLGLVLLWGGLVLTWGNPVDSRERTRVVSPTMIRFIGDPGAFAPPRESLLAFMRHPNAGPGEIESSVAADAARPLSAHPHFLAMQREGRDSRGVGAAGDLAAQVSRRMLGYVPEWRDVDPFPPPPTLQLRYVIEPSGDLSAGGFVVPETALAAIDGGEQAWDLKVDIVCGEDGAVRDVMALKESSLNGAQSNVVRLLQQTHARSGEGCRGMLTVRWARVPVSPADSTRVGKDAAWQSGS